VQDKGGSNEGRREGASVPGVLHMPPDVLLVGATQNSTVRSSACNPSLQNDQRQERTYGLAETAVEASAAVVFADTAAPVVSLAAERQMASEPRQMTQRWAK
jgi:hypothetical protein